MAGVVTLAGLMTSGLLPAADKPAAKSGIDFSRAIRPLLANKCLKCHGPGRLNGDNDLRLDRPKSAIGTAIVPGRPDQSELIKRVTSKDPKKRMPPPESKLELTGKDIELLKKWISEGADYTVHWSFVSPVRPDVPGVKRSDWILNTIDRFVLSRIERAGLKPSPATDRESLIRRLTFDLTGLPPTEREIDRFLSDKSLRAYERLVDRLLSSQHYGERMAQTWLDLARFGDTNGYENDSDRSMWLYRDWVINAFNTNMPFDRFALEQVAGDLLPHASSSQRIASGFNRNTTYNEEGGSDPEEFQVVYAVERASTTGTVFMGLTLGCAQCHEHKYDPISQEEFYSFYAFFNSVDGEKGAQGHDIPLPPLLVLSTPQQEVESQQLTKDLATLDKTLAPGMLAFRNGLVLDLSDADRPAVRALAPADCGSATGTVDRDLPPRDVLGAKWADDELYGALRAKLGKNFSDGASARQVLERLAWAILHGKPNDAKWGLERSGPADGGKTMLLTALAKCLPGLVKKINISLFSTAESKKSSGPNEALGELQAVRLAYAEEPPAGLELDGGFL